MLTSLWLVLFFSYGHVYQVIEGKIAGRVCGWQTPLSGRALAGDFRGRQSVGPQKAPCPARELNLVLNVISAVLVLFPLVQVGAFASGASARRCSKPARPPGSRPLPPPARGQYRAGCLLHRPRRLLPRG